MNIHMTAITEVLGPYKRFAVWVQGCSLGCFGCIASVTHDPKVEEIVDENLLAQQILSHSDIEGITISGGEPFEQIDAVYKLVKIIKSISNLGIIIYSGFSIEELRQKSLKNNRIQLILDAIDILIDGRYIQHLNDGKSLRGSSNQKVHVLSPRYEAIVKNYYGLEGRKTEFILNDKEIKMVGLPSKDYDIIFEMLQNKKESM